VSGVTPTALLGLTPWLADTQGAPVDPGNATYDPELALNRFIVFRSNKVLHAPWPRCP
jgi:hypothetical protein